MNPSLNLARYLALGVTLSLVLMAGGTSLAQEASTVAPALPMGRESRHHPTVRFRSPRKPDWPARPRIRWLRWLEPSPWRRCRLWGRTRSQLR
jgi:hypothetical protein